MGAVEPLFAFREGHFLLESGHHGALWMDLETLCLRPEPVRRAAFELAERVRPHAVDIVCGPLVEGAFVALLAAEPLGVRFVYAERHVEPGASGLYPVRYRLPATLRPHVHGRRVAIVNDVVNAGSAVRGAFEDLQACGANVVVMAALAVLGTWAERFTAEQGIALEALTQRPNEIWAPLVCPLCADGRPLVRPGG